MRVSEDGTWVSNEPKLGEPPPPPIPIVVQLSRPESADRLLVETASMTSNDAVRFRNVVRDQMENGASCEAAIDMTRDWFSSKGLASANVGYWRTREGRLLAIRDMETNHIENAMAIIARVRGSLVLAKNDRKWQEFDAELRRRAEKENAFAPPRREANIIDEKWLELEAFESENLARRPRADEMSVKRRINLKGK